MLTRAPWRRRSDRGSVTAEFVLVSILLTALTLGVVQLSIALYVKNVFTDAAIEGSRIAARADGSLSDGENRIREILAASVNSGVIEEITVRGVTSGSLEFVEVVITGALPILGLWGLPGSLSATGTSIQER